MTWVIRAYDQQDELTAEHPLALSTRALKKRLHAQPDEFASMRLSTAQLVGFADLLEVKQGREYFLDFDADRGTPLRHSSSGRSIAGRFGAFKSVAGGWLTARVAPRKSTRTR
jgi:hypothetical protein